MPNKPPSTQSNQPEYKGRRRGKTVRAKKADRSLLAWIVALTLPLVLNYCTAEFASRDVTLTLDRREKTNERNQPRR